MLYTQPLDGRRSNFLPRNTFIHQTKFLRYQALWGHVILGYALGWAWLLQLYPGFGVLNKRQTVNLSSSLPLSVLSHSSSFSVPFPQTSVGHPARVSQSRALDAREEPLQLADKGAQVESISVAQQIRRQRELQDLERRYRERAEAEQGLLYARISELEGMLLASRTGNMAYVWQLSGN